MQCDLSSANLYGTYKLLIEQESLAGKFSSSDFEASSDFTLELLATIVVLNGDKKPRKRTYEQIKVDENENCSSLGSPSEPPQDCEGTLDLVRALQDLENAASGDAAVHQRIASLPVEVQEVSLLDKITDKESGERLSKMVEDACMLLADYNGRLAAEIDDRKQLTRMLADFLRCQKEALAEKEHKLEYGFFNFYRASVADIGHGLDDTSMQFVELQLSILNKGVNDHFEVFTDSTTQVKSRKNQESEMLVPEIAESAQIEEMLWVPQNRQYS
ncbi:hypothetical protein P7K49_028186 [Saguinus oedipus]|uniref:Regulation of nuclear pre-mRNA domain-containing protein n=1 Tax=Saguinus oedipus TaxID=9490 RepID=A0ABQ9UCU5_SAGOE|nr:hypothetical protein P7K49_028186 [Saguinus oedipus]